MLMYTMFIVPKYNKIPKRNKIKKIKFSFPPFSTEIMKKIRNLNINPTENNKIVKLQTIYWLCSIHKIVCCSNKRKLYIDL